MHASFNLVFNIKEEIEKRKYACKGNPKEKGSSLEKTGIRSVATQSLSQATVSIPD